MAISKGVNSYVNLIEAEVYMANRIDVDAWDRADEDSRIRALVTAAVLLDSKLWSGTAVSAEQPMAFPRNETYFDPKVGYALSMNPTPARIQNGQIELAYHLLNNEGLLDDTGGVDTLGVGSVTLGNIRKASTIPSIVLRLVGPLLMNGYSSGSSWWRAN